MGSGKQSNSDTSSEEIDQPEKVIDDNTGIGRSYECTFCKRGFTNAQALGGHMNIHRKDKAKAKAKQKNHQESSLRNKSYEDYTTSKYFAPVLSEQHQYSTAVGAHMSYPVYFPASNPSYLHGYHQYDLPSPRPDHLRLHEYPMDQSLSLSIGLPHMEDDEERLNNRNETDIDLELRLGHHP